MTTKITIDAHAGWPILVVKLVGEPSQEKTILSQIVEPFEKADIFIHSGLKILHIEELPIKKTT